MSKDIENEILQALHVARQKIVGKNIFLNNLTSFSLEKYRAFAIERYRAAEAFETLLALALDLAQKAKLAPLIQALTQNLADEQGINAEGFLDQALAHATWRHDFYTALGIDESMIHNYPTSQGTLFYQKSIHELIASQSLWKIVGAILTLEATIPAEFQRLQAARDSLFSDCFIVHPRDTTEIKTKKLRARKYLDDHIVHDAKAHYPQLLQAIVASLTPADFAELKAGIEIITEAKHAFYENL